MCKIEFGSVELLGIEVESFRFLGLKKRYDF